MVDKADLIYETLQQHRIETKSDMSELRAATRDLVTSVAQLGATVARVEERHATHEDELEGIYASLKDHGQRLGYLENKAAFANASWKTIGVIASVVVFIAGAAISIVGFLV